MGRGVSDNPGERFRFVDARRIPGHACEEHSKVDNLVTCLVQAMRGTLTGNRKQRGTVETGVGDPGCQVGCTRAERCCADTCLASQSAKDVGHECRCLLVARDDKASRAWAQCIDGIQVLFARDTEDVADAGCLQAADKQAGAAVLPRHLASSSRIGLLTLQAHRKTVDMQLSRLIWAANPDLA